MTRETPAAPGRWPDLLLLWGPVAAFLALSYSLSSVPGDDLRLPFSDLLAHFLEFALLGMLLMRGFHGGMAARVRPGRVALALAAALAWALFDEFHQSLVPGRVPSLRDLGSDAVGAAVAAAVFPWVSRGVQHWRPRGRAPAALTFLTRAGCHLCHDARELVERVAPEYGFSVEIVDVDSRDDLARTYGDSVPVLLVGGRKAFKLRIAESDLRRRLARHRREAG